MVVVGGGIMGSWSTVLLTKLARLNLVKVRGDTYTPNKFLV